MHSPVGYSHLAKVHGGTLLFIAGQVALDASGNLVGKGDFRAQAQQVFENLKAAVEAAGGSFSNIIKLNVYVADSSKLPEYRQVRDSYIDSRNPPASTAIQVAALFRPDFLNRNRGSRGSEVKRGAKPEGRNRYQPIYGLQTSVQQWETKALVDVVTVDGRPLQSAGHECHSKGHEGLEFIDGNLAVAIRVGIF